MVFIDPEVVAYLGIYCGEGWYRVIFPTECRRRLYFEEYTLEVPAVLFQTSTYVLITVILFDIGLHSKDA